MDRTTNYLQRISYETLSKNMPLSRNLFDRSVKSISNKSDRQTIDKGTLFSRCSFCYNQLKPESCRMKLVPKPGLTKHVRQLMKRMGQTPPSIGSYQKKLVQNYIHKPNKLVIVCTLCKKSNVLKGQSRLERQKQKDCVEQEREEQLQMELPVEPVKTRRDKKKERRKLLRKKKQNRELDDDINAGLLLPTSDKTTDNERSGKIENAQQIMTDSRIVDNQRTKPIDVNGAVTSPGNDSVRLGHVGAGKTNTDVKHATHSSALTNLIDIAEKTSGKIKSDKAKLSITDRNRKMPTSVSGHMSTSGIKGHSPGIAKSHKSLIDKKNKAKKMSQQLGRLLKQEQTKSTGGSLTDFLSSL